MVIYRSIGYSHDCPPSGCLMCKESYGPPPPNPENEPQCCRYLDNGEHVIVVLAESPMLVSSKSKPKRPRAAAAAGATRELTRRVTIKAAKAMKKAKKSAKPTRAAKRAAPSRAKRSRAGK